MPVRAWTEGDPPLFGGKATILFGVRRPPARPPAGGDERQSTEQAGGEAAPDAYAADPEAGDRPQP